MAKGEGQNVAYVQIDDLPEYKMTLLKKGITTDDDGIFNEVKKTGTTYYKYYAIMESDEEKAYVSNYEQAQQVIDGLNSKNSTNKDSVQIVEKYETELKEFTESETVISNLYKAPVKVVAKKTTTRSGTANTSSNSSSQYVPIGITLIAPISGTITSRFGAISSVRTGSHTGLDIAAPSGTAIKAAAGGTVTYSGYQGSLGNLIIISHGNGVQTYYGHCSALLASVGETVSQGQVIARVGSTGNSTGYHLHIEVRVNGVAYNPQNYVY